MNFKSFGVKILSVCLFALLLQGCRKDSIEEHDILDKQQKEVGFRSGTFPVDLEADVRLWWENHRSTDIWDTVNPNILTLDPVWEFGYETWIGALPVFLVPVSNDLDEEIPDSRYNLIFIEADDELDVRLLVFQSKESVSGDWDLNTFSGIAFNVDRSAQVQGLHLFRQGYYIELTQTLLDSLAALDLGGGDNSFDPGCYSSWGPSWLSRIWNRISGWDIWHWEWDWANGSGNNSGGGGGSWFGGLWGPGDGPGDFGPGFLGLGGGIGIGANSSGPSPNHIPLSSNLLFSNEILNEGFKKLKHCDLNIEQKQDQVSLGGFMAQADYFKDRFDPYFSSGVDIYIQESGVRPLNEILQQPDHKWNWVNGHPYTKLLAPWARHLSAMIISKKVSDLYKYCIQHPNANQAQVGNPSYSSDLCECMDQYSLGDANLDYTVDYLWTPEPFVTPNFATNVATSWPLIHGLGIRYDVDAIQDFYFNECTTHVSPETFEDCALNLSATWKHNELTLLYPDYAARNIDISTFMATHGADVYLATATIYQTYIEEVGITPDDPYKWQLMMEVFAEELGPLFLELIPGGIGDLIGAYNSFNDGDYWMASLNLVLVFVPANEVVNAFHKGKDIRKGFKAVGKIVILWNKLLSLPGGQKVLNKMPQAWKSLPGSKLSKYEDGLYWQKEGNYHLRLMDAKPNGFPSQQVPYAKFHKGNSFIDINGNPVSGNSPEAHIPINQLTDSFLHDFFN